MENLKMPDLQSTTNVEILRRPKLFDVLNPEKRLLYYTGFYPLKRNAFFYFSRFVNLAFSFLMLITMAIRMVMDLPNMKTVLQTLQFSMTQFAFLAKSIPFMLKNNYLLKMEEELKNPVFHTYTEDQDKFVQIAIDNNLSFGRVFRIVLVFTILFYLIFPLTDNQVLPVGAWFPFDIYKYQYVLILYQGICFVMNAYSNSGVDLVMTGYIGIMGAQLDILKDTLMKATVVDGSKGMTKEEIDEVVSQRVFKCVIQHDAILKFVTKIEDMFSAGVFLQFFASILTICFTGIMMIWVQVKSMQFFALCFYLVCMINQLTLSCWFGHDIMSRSEGLTNACYMNQWYECGAKTQQGLFMIMERAKRPIKLTAGKIADLNLSTLMTILKSSYSYYAVLQRLYK